MIKEKSLSGEVWRGMPIGHSRLSETPSLLDFRRTLGNDSVLQCALHQYLNGSYWYSVASPVADNTAKIREE